ncbi:MAG: BREX-1 system adenine-specific DNA-methyltransferase PglX [Acidobacteria bacterium]|nr:BREX-1 system adenine-specific DNA-methyltransferase PglX [Acidobacteriota bacterium]
MMEAILKGCLKAIALELRRQLEGYHDAQGNWQAGDLERRLAAIGVRRDRPPVPVGELPHLSREDRDARRVVDAFLKVRADAGVDRGAAVAEFVAKSAYTWANRLLALRCMEARGLIDEVILQKDVYGGRSLQHNRLARKAPEGCAGEDEGLFAVLFDEFERRGRELPLLFNPKAPEVALRPSIAVLKRCIALLSGTQAVKGQEAAADEVFSAPDALGWAYQYWNTEEKDRVFEKVRTKKGAKIEGAQEIISATCIYTEPYIVKFLVQNSLGALWAGMHPESRLPRKWVYFVRDAHRAPVRKKSAREITFLDPACGSGHFLIEAFDLLYAMYQEEGEITAPSDICAAILERNLYGIDIDERAVQIAALALVMKAKEKAPDFVPRRVNLVATNIRVPTGKDHLESFLRKHPEDEPLKPALLTVFEGLAHADELGSLLQIEEPVVQELRRLRQLYEARKGKAKQTVLWPELEEPVQGRLPLGLESYDAWQERTIERLRQHFDAQAQGPDLVAALFGEAGARGLSLVDVLGRRYDVVAANPPYMGSKNMDAILKKHVERHFPAGKRDLYAAFILRCLELARDSGRVAMVTQQSWMFLRSFSNLRALDDEKRRSAPRAFGGILRESTIEALVHLGEHAFAETAAAGAFVALFVLSRAEPGPEHRLSAFRLIGPKNPEEKDVLLKQAIRNGASAISFKPHQARFLSIPQAPLCYWLRERFFELLAGRVLGEVAACQNGVTTYNNRRFLRKHWEVHLPESHGYIRFAKGGGFARWAGLDEELLWWGANGERLKAYIDQTYPYLDGNYGWALKENTFFKHGWTWTLMARGALGVRQLDGQTLFDSASPSAFANRALPTIGAVLNCRAASYLLRSISFEIKFRESYVARCPIPEGVPPGLQQLENACIILKRWLTGREVTERTFEGLAPTGASLLDGYRRRETDYERVSAVLHALEGISERVVFTAYGIEGEDLEAVLDETGTPAGWFPLIAACDAIPQLPTGVGVLGGLLAPLASEPRRTLSAEELAHLKRRLHALCEAGPGAKVDDDEAAAGEEGEDDENESAVSGARIPIPAETFLEDLSQKLEVHPISLYGLLREMREKDGVICQPELRRSVEDCVSVLVLRLLGHCWPKQIEVGEPLPAWADAHGIIPLTEGAGNPTMLERVRERIAEDFGPGRVNVIEQEFEQIADKALGTWLATEFFSRHISQFKKRPIAWHIESARSGGKRGRRVKGNVPPAFSCLVYYHRLDGDLLPKLRSQYVNPLRARVQTELAGLERLDERTADQDERRVQLEMLLEELKDFDARLEQIITTGFASPVLDAIAAKEPLDEWTSRDGHAPHPMTRETFLAQERRYDPDLNDGVRVNIAPLQKSGLLAADVLAAKDVEKAIADRAEWRADERRWCREGKLSQPGWWPSKGVTKSAPANRVEARR